MEKFREQFKKEKDFTYWAEGCDYGSFNDNYVNWLEKKLALNIADVSQQSELLLDFLNVTSPSMSIDDKHAIINAYKRNKSNNCG
jgi:hypothetical protein